MISKTDINKIEAFEMWFGKGRRRSVGQHIKMAIESVIVCDALCFTRHKFGKTNVKSLQSAWMDYYDVEELSVAKCQLLKDISALNSTVKFPHGPQSE